MFRALIPPIFRSTRLCVTLCGIVHSMHYRPATSWMHYTTSCNTQSSAPEDGWDQSPKHFELIGIINKPLLLHIVGVYIIYINDARSNKYQMHYITLIIIVKLVQKFIYLILSSFSFVLRVII
jgi:hypothetical protein